MSLWRLELARLTRTSRGIALLVVYTFFGVLGPLSAAYLPEIVQWAGAEGMEVALPEPTPIDGLIQFVSNASQLGTLAVVIVAAAALSLDARPEQAAFLRTRVPRASDLVVPRYVTVAGASVVAMLLGTGVAVILTHVLLGSLPLAEVLVGALLGALYLAFAISVVAAMASFLRTALTTTFASIAVLLVLPALGILDAVASYLPSTLVSAVAAVPAGEPVGDYLRAIVVTMLVTVALVLVAVYRVGRREI